MAGWKATPDRGSLNNCNNAMPLTSEPLRLVVHFQTAEFQFILSWFCLNMRSHKVDAAIKESRSNPVSNFVVAGGGCSLTIFGCFFFLFVLNKNTLFNVMYKCRIFKRYCPSRMGQLLSQSRAVELDWVGSSNVRLEYVLPNNASVLTVCFEYVSLETQNSKKFLPCRWTLRNFFYIFFACRAISVSFHKSLAVYITVLFN